MDKGKVLSKKQHVEASLRQLWMAYLDLSEANDGLLMMSDQDTDIWNSIAQHPALYVIVSKILRVPPASAE